MTNKEAIEELKDLKDYCHSTFMKRTYEAYTQAINKAIEALENQKTVIEKLEEMKDEIENTGAYEQEVHGKTEFLKGITYCLNIIDKHIKELKGE